RHNRSRRTAVRLGFSFGLAGLSRLGLLMLPASAELAIECGTVDARFRAIGLALCGLANWYFDGWRTTRGSSTIADAKHDNCTAMGRANHHYVCRGGLDSAPTNADARDDAGRVSKCRMQHAEGRIWEEDLLPFSAARWYCFCTRNWLMATAGR